MGTGAFGKLNRTGLEIFRNLYLFDYYIFLSNK